MAKKRGWGIKWRLPSRLEAGLFFLGFLIWLVLDYSQNLFQDTGDLNVISVFGIKAITLFWITVLLYHGVLYTAIVRSLVVKGTHPNWDFLFGSLAVLGTYCIIGGAIAGIYYDASEPVPWFFNVAQITLYHVGGVLLQVLAFIWFVSTD